MTPLDALETDLRAALHFAPDPSRLETLAYRLKHRLRTPGVLMTAERWQALDALATVALGRATGARERAVRAAFRTP
jgi:hypothetical protein